MPLYPSAIAYIKTRTFEVWAPAFYYPTLPKEMTDPDANKVELAKEYQRVNPYMWKPINKRPPPRLRPTLDPNQLQRSAYSIEVILDMFRKKVEFQLANEEDVVEMMDAIDRYLISLEDDVKMGVERVVAYARVVTAFRGELYKHYYRYMTLHPEAKAALYPNNDPNKNFTSLISAMGIRGDMEQLDPLRAKAKPPYDIDKSLPKDIQANKTSESDDYYGGSSSTMVESEEFKFNFDDFVKNGR